MNLLEVNNATKTFGNLVAMRDVSLAVKPGELRAIIGPNGAGKTTFFNMISGFLRPTSGNVVFDGRDVTALPAHERVKIGMARTFQITEIFPELTLHENVRIAVEVEAGYRLRPCISRSESAEVTRRIDETLTLVGLTTKANRLVGELAHGDQRSAEIAMALALRPRLFLFDEPTAGMGDQETYEITQLIRRLHRDNNFTIVLIEHDMRVVFHLADPLRFSIRASYWQKVRRRKSRRMKSFRPLIWGRPHERRTRSSRSSHVLWQEPHSARCQPRRRRRKHHNAARSQWRRQVDNSAKPYGAHSGARGENHHLRNRYHRDGAISDCRDGCGVCAGRPARVRELDGRRKSARPDRAERFLDDRADLR